MSFLLQNIIRLIKNHVKLDEETILTFLLSPWSMVLLEKHTGSQVLKKFSAYYGTRRFITAFTGAHHLSLS
jgi:hypothetical protein